TSTVISGEPAALATVLASLEARGVYARLLSESFAFHSRQMEPFQAALETSLQGLRPGRGRIVLVSTVTGRPAAEGEYGPAYWARNIRERVRFAEAVAACASGGRSIFLELAPHPVLGSMVARCAVGGHPLRAIPSLRRGVPER